MSRLSEKTYVRRELDFAQDLRLGDRGAAVRRVQEWLTYHGSATAIDGQFGPATERCVTRFQAANAITETGIVDGPTWGALVEPMADAVAAVLPQPGEILPDYLLRCARAHLKQRPVEVGGDNRGPWVRLYMAGNEGSTCFWCAGFVTFVLRQACEGLEMDMPIAGSFSCDLLAEQARSNGRFIRGASIDRGDPAWRDLGDAQIFLVRRSSNDWTHTGFSFEGHEEVFSTIEGNTNDDGSSNGYEVCERTRTTSSKDFIRLTA